MEQGWVSPPTTLPTPSRPNFSLFSTESLEEEGVRFHNALCVPVPLGLSVSVLSLPSTSLGPRLSTQPHPHFWPRAGARRSRLSRNPRTRDCPHGLLRASLPPRMGYLCGVPRRTGAAPRSPRFPRATAVPSWLKLRRVQPVPALGSRSATCSRAGFGPRAQRSPGAAGRPAPGCREALWDSHAGPHPVTGGTRRPGARPQSSTLRAQTWVQSSQGCARRCKGPSPSGRRGPGASFPSIPLRFFPPFPFFLFRWFRFWTCVFSLPHCHGYESSPVGPTRPPNNTQTSHIYPVICSS